MVVEIESYSVGFELKVSVWTYVLKKDREKKGARDGVGVGEERERLIVHVYIYKGLEAMTLQ